MANVLVAEVYPRACGGTPRTSPWCLRYDRGLSPRLRGNPRTDPWLLLLRTGLSPRLRGNLINGTVTSVSMRMRSIPAPAGEPQSIVSGFPVVVYGSIPAPAGEPGGTYRLDHIDLNEVYPRACGGTTGDKPQFSGVRYGSIPAPAGEPRICSK